MRECGDCSLCCKLLGIYELDKPAGKWCVNARLPGGGCNIYHDRPHSCRTFACGWLVNSTFGDHWHPKRAKMIVSMNIDDDANHLMQIWVDPSNAYGWQKEPYKSDIAKLARDGAGSYTTEIRLPNGTIHKVT